MWDLGLQINVQFCRLIWQNQVQSFLELSFLLTLKFMHLLLTHIYCFITCRESQVELREHIDNLATGNTRYYIQSLWALHAGKLIVCVCVCIFVAELCRINEHQKVALDLDPYVKKLLNARRRVVLVNNILQNAQVSVCLCIRGLEGLSLMSSHVTRINQSGGKWHLVLEDFCPPHGIDKNHVNVHINELL